MSDIIQTIDFDTSMFETTIQFLQQDLASVDLALAINYIEQWEHQLQGTAIFEDLMALKQALLNASITEMTAILRKLGEETSAAANDARQDGAIEAATKVEQIGQLLLQASQNVR